MPLSFSVHTCVCNAIRQLSLKNWVLRQIALQTVWTDSFRQFIKYTVKGTSIGLWDISMFGCYVKSLMIVFTVTIIMATLCSRCGHYIFVLRFLSSFFIPRLISAIADCMYTILLHMMWPWCEFRMQVWNVLHVACWKCRTQKIAKNSPSGHHRTSLSGCIFATKAHIDNRKKSC